nr:hypothetical protein [Paenibacillus xylanexedens]
MKEYLPAELSYVIDQYEILKRKLPIPWVVDGKQRLEITKRYYYNFMDGYVKENTVDRTWLELIPDFINLRQFGLVSAIYRSYNFDNYNNWSNWDKEALKFYLNNIEHDIPYIDIDFSR